MKILRIFPLAFVDFSLTSSFNNSMSHNNSIKPKKTKFYIDRILIIMSMFKVTVDEASQLTDF